MKASEAYAKSKDGKIWLNGRAAVSCSPPLRPTFLAWKSSREIVALKDVCSDEWEPEKPKIKCKACEEVDVRKGFLIHGADPLIQHLKDYHCTCEVTK